MVIVVGALLLVGVVVLVVWNININRNNPVRKALKKAQAEAKVGRRKRRSGSGNDGTYSSSGDSHDGGGSWWDGGGDSGGGDSGGGGGGD
ncbi:hypothetical protein OHA21_10810 [Actinoplanes sp. NBC_00393]|uniref:hypothetical protein n=1 Tax=Actinoplanes sp. NBC_00393 TaxID=2975953 RepID=UPI002E1AB353